MKNVAIVGGAGFIGRALCRRLESDNLATVTVFDVCAPSGAGNPHFRKLDVLCPADVDDAIRDYDVVYHKVGLMGPARSFEEPMRSYRLNLESTLNVLKACADGGVKQFVFDSTQSVFGPADRSPFYENQTPHPASLYGAAKYMAERYVLYFGARCGLCAAALRYPRVVSPGHANLLQGLQDRVANREPITISAGGRRAFDVVHLSDVIGWNIWFLDNLWSGIMHVSPGLCVSAAEIADGFARRLHGEPSYRFLTYSPQETENDRLLPGRCVLNGAQSQHHTGLPFKFRTLSQFLEAFCHAKGD